MEETYKDVLYQMTKIPTTKSTIVLDERNLFYQKDLKPYLFKSKDIKDVFETLEYLLKRYGKAIYVKILDNKIQDFIPFKNPLYRNEWQLRFDSDFKKGFVDIGDDNFGVALLDNFIIRHYDNDTEILWIRDMIYEVCKNREIKDCEFFINSERNMPMISLNRSEADTVLYGNNVLDYEAPLIQHTVLSFNTSDKFKDIPIPTFYDFNRMSTNIFGIEDFKSMKWSEKENVFLYRGDSISYGVDTDKNSRLLLVKKLKSYENQDMINAGITQFYTNVPFVQMGYVYYTKENKDLYPDKDLDIPSKYKFIFVVDGIGHADELSTLMFSGSCLLRVESEYKSWFDELITPGTHYISVSKNLDDLEDKMQWCLDHDEECKKIGLNAREFAVKYLSKNSICDYFQYIFNFIPSLNYESEFYQLTLSDIQYERQSEYINKVFKEISFIQPLKKVDFNNAKGDILQDKKNLRFSYGTNVALFYISIFNQYLIENYLEKLTFNDIKDGVNAVFIGLKCINELYREIPNFSYTYNYYTDVNGDMVVVYEKLFNKMTLEDFIMRRPEKSTEIFIQIFLALQLAFERCCFQHGNLSPENVFIQTLDNPIKIVYNLLDKALAINTKYVVVITNFSKSKALCNFKQYDNKTQRMFVGRYNEFDNLTPNSEKLGDKLESVLHVQGSKDIKYLMKKIGKKVKNSIVTEIQSDTPIDDTQINTAPIDVMKDVIKKTDIVKNKIRFGQVSENSVNVGRDEENPRLIYDSMIGENKPHDKVYERVFSNPLPQEETVLGNVILQYEISQSIRSALADLNMKFNIDLVASDRLKAALNFVKNFYDKLIENTTKEFADDDYENLGFKTLVKKYTKPILGNKNTIHVFEKVVKVMASTILDTILKGIKNTIKFYDEDD